jgi:beta-aspartyl-peptidase (threonine type)
MERAIADGLDAAADAGWGRLVEGDPLGAVVEAVAHLEDHGGFNAGRGSVPTTDGTVEMDAGVMTGDRRAAGVAGLRRHSAVRAAAALLEAGGAVLLAGAGAERFAAERHIPELSPRAAVAPTGRVTDPSALHPPTSPGIAAPDGTVLSEQGTVGAVALGGRGGLAAATSTGGRPDQPPGRVGDSPIPGAGLWADGRCALSATGAGEAFILAGFSASVARRVAEGAAPGEALRGALDDVASFGGAGGSIMITAGGRYAVGVSSPGMSWSVRHVGGRRTIVAG